jgi:hypothetical protein
MNHVSSSAVSKRFAFPASNFTCSWIFLLHGLVSVSFALICSSWLSSIFHRVLLRFGQAQSPAVLSLCFRELRTPVGSVSSDFLVHHRSWVLSSFLFFLA